MHLLPIQGRSLDEEAPAVDLNLTPADILVLSFTDTDLAVVTAAWEQDRERLPSLRLVRLADLKHPYSVDLFVEKLAAKARFVLVRLLGGADYWRYGVDELAAAARRHGFALAVLPGCERDDPRLAEASTVSAGELGALRDYFEAGGVENIRLALRWIDHRLGTPNRPAPPEPVPAAGIWRAGCRASDGPRVIILFYRSALLAADTAPIAALAEALADRGAAVTSVFVSSLKDAESIEILRGCLRDDPPDVVVNTTAFSARGADGCVVDEADVPVLQASLAGSTREAWSASPRGLGAADLAMNVVLPELDGRIGAGAISFKGEAELQSALEFAPVTHRPDPAGIAHTADLALAWAALRRLPRGERRLACILSDYPGKAGRGGYAVGLDTAASVDAIAEALRGAGFDVGELPPAATLMAELENTHPQPIIGLNAYRDSFAVLPAAFRDSVTAAWGEPTADPDCVDGAFRHRVLRAGKFVVAIQPDRGRAESRRADFHDSTLPPRHAYVAFHLWLRQVERIHAMIHLGTHGTLEWLPGKAVALGEDCAPRVLTGALPVLYPFIVSNPGEAAQAKRRIGAVTIGHLTPPLIEAGTSGDTAELEAMFDEYAEALSLDARRAQLLGRAILDRAAEHGLLSPIAEPVEPADALARLDSWLCDIKDARIGDGLHVFGRGPIVAGDPSDLDQHGPIGLILRPACGEKDEPHCAANSEPCNLPFETCGPAELDGLLRALDGRFVAPGPAGAPSANRTDVLPTGRNLYAVDPRAVPTRTAWEIGSRMAEDLVTRYAQDHGSWPRRIVLDLWGSATMRTGGDDLAQAFALMGVRPQWDNGSTRVSGYEILPLARLGRSRIDVTLHISGLFRDAFPHQIALFDSAARAVAALEEEDEDNPLAEAFRAGETPARVFGAAPGAYGVGLASQLTAEAATDRETLAETYLAAASHAFPSGQADRSFRARVAQAEAGSHTDDLLGQDLLESDVHADSQGGFAAAATLLGANPALYRADTTTPGAPRLRTLPEAISRALHARAANPRWIAGQMRHGHRGAIALAETLDALYAFAATTDAVPSRHFDTYFDVTLGDDRVRDFLLHENPAAARGMAEKFEAALSCGYWTSMRNSSRAILGALTGQPSRAPTEMVG